ncbi:hypothetical protein EMMF5_001996 [Cystobasidiomycetes sp. EMM_F5]
MQQWTQNELEGAGQADGSLASIESLQEHPVGTSQDVYTFPQLNYLHGANMLHGNDHNSGAWLSPPSHTLELRYHDSGSTNGSIYSQQTHSDTSLRPPSSGRAARDTSPNEAAQVAPVKVPRPPNAWILYRSDQIVQLRAKMPEGAARPTQADLSKIFGEQWRNETEAVKLKYEGAAEAARELHAQKYPDWKFARRPPREGLVAKNAKAAGTGKSRGAKAALKQSSAPSVPIRDQAQTEGGVAADQPSFLLHAPPGQPANVQAYSTASSGYSSATRRNSSAVGLLDTSMHYAPSLTASQQYMSPISAYTPVYASQHSAPFSFPSQHATSDQIATFQYTPDQADAASLYATQSPPPLTFSALPPSLPFGLDMNNDETWYAAPSGLASAPTTASDEFFEYQPETWNSSLEQINVQMASPVMTPQIPAWLTEQEGLRVRASESGATLKEFLHDLYQKSGKVEDESGLVPPGAGSDGPYSLSQVYQGVHSGHASPA